MSSNNNNNNNNNVVDDDDDRKPSAISSTEPTASVPEWRSVMIAPASEPEIAGARPSSIPRPKGFGSPPATASANNDVIDKSSFFKPAPKEATTRASSSDLGSNWVPTQLRPVPAFYPLERSSRFVEDELPAVAARLSECHRVLSVQAIYNNESATAALITSENVEMHLSLWKTVGGKYPPGIVVELQRRKGDSIAFHRYARHILDAAIGDFDPAEHLRTKGIDMDVVYSKNVQRLLDMGNGKEPATEQENAIIAIEIAHGLLMKDRMDARKLGLESLCLLTDPKKTGNLTALIASHVVLLGTAQGFGIEQEGNMLFDEAPFQEIRETILSLIQLRRIGDIDGLDAESLHLEEQDHINVLHNLALAVLANSLEVIENEERYETEPEDSKPRARMESASSIAETFINEASEMNDKEILSTLIKELGRAEHKPHNACLSAKCLGSLLGASEEARRRAKELGAKNVVQTALEVGTRTHLKLETECKNVETKLTQTEDNNNDEN